MNLNNLINLIKIIILLYYTFEEKNQMIFKKKL